MMKQQRGAVRAVINITLFLLLLLSGCLCSTSGFLRKYYYINMSMIWTEAQSYCRERYTDLATVDSMNDVDRLVNIVDSGYSGSVWIGLQRAAVGQWFWSNGEDTVRQYTGWAAGEPSGDGTCVNFPKGNWNDCPCSVTLNFVCYNESIGNIPILISKTWRDAQSYCRQYHTDLATVHSAVEQSQLYSLVGVVSSVWIGLFFDTWQWSDQWSLFFRNWAAGYTSMSSGTGDCVAMSTTASGKWVQSPCTEQHPFMCYDDVKKQIVRLSLSCGENCNLNDPSLQSVILNEIGETLQSIGVESYISINWRKSSD